MGRKATNLTGKEYGKLTVIERGQNSKHGGSRWICSCECGGRTLVQLSNLKSGSVKSCGCLKYEATKKHGGTSVDGNDRLYNIWASMKSRIKNKNNQDYKDYGGRGIKLCKEWEEFVPFRNWALKNGYEDGLSIDRIDNDGDYQPNNCRWATSIEQARNKRNNHMIDIDGETKCLVEWVEFYKAVGVSYDTVKKRINNYGWEPKRALTQPVGGKK